MTQPVATTSTDVDARHPKNHCDAPRRMGLHVKGSRLEQWIKGLSFALIVIALFVIVRSLPMDRAIDLLKLKVEGMGFWGLIALGVVYIVAALAFFPGSALTLTAGAVFGLAWGTLTVSLASTTAASLAFLISRYLMRDKVATFAQRNPKFASIDGAIGEGGWKIIAMLRLSPVMPFSLGNYLFGLTSIRFWPYLLASWLFMLPGTFMYIYLGHITAEGLRSTANAEQGQSLLEWVLLGVGLLATITVTVYIARLSKAALRKRTRIEDRMMKPKNPSESIVQAGVDVTGWPWGTTVLAVVAVTMMAMAACTYQQRDALKSMFGPAQVTLHESYLRDSDGLKFDHSTFDTLLRKHVDTDGWIDYEGFLRDAASLDAYITTLHNAPFDELGRDEKLAFLINAYNAFTLRLILDYYPLKSIKDIPSATRWDARRWRIGSMTLSLNQIEHEQIRPKFAEPRIHFALVCAAIGCPKLRNEAYQASRIEQQLEDQTIYVHEHGRWFRYERGTKTLYLTKLYSWYGDDFKQVAGSVVDFASRYSTPLKAEIDEGSKPRIQWLDYDWTLNDSKNNH